MILQAFTSESRAFKALFVDLTEVCGLSLYPVVGWGTYDKNNLIFVTAMVLPPYPSGRLVAAETLANFVGILKPDDHINEWLARAQEVRQRIAEETESEEA